MSVSVVDLFAGAGGLSLGLTRAGACVVCAVEAGSDAAATYAANHPETVVLETEIDVAWELPRQFRGDLDILAGGPPCQGWSTLGHRGSPQRREKQKAALSLFMRQVRLVRPRAVLLENVRGLFVSEGGRRVAEVEGSFAEMGYRVESKLLRAADYGVPQLRHRLFIVATRADLPIAYSFPREVNEDPPTVADAISDLPSLCAGTASAEYGVTPSTKLQHRLRDHVQELTLHHAPRHPAELLALIEALPLDGGSVRDLPESLKPKSGFHNTYARLRAGAPAPAVTSSIGRVSSGRHVHPTQHRALTPREAARLQTFPDSYLWEGRGRWSIYEQIGNAVPPDLATAVASPLVEALARLRSARAAA